MKKRYWIAGLSGLASVAVAAKLLSRPRDVEWLEHSGKFILSEYAQIAEIDGVRVLYHEAGPKDSPAIILIHGFTAFSLVWSEVLLPIAAAGFRLISSEFPQIPP